MNLSHPEFYRYYVINCLGKSLQKPETKKLGAWEEICGVFVEGCVLPRGLMVWTQVYPRRVHVSGSWVPVRSPVVQRQTAVSEKACVEEKGCVWGEEL